ncbi:hypothetical protein [Peptostreptococcus porci]|uniref:hypothetical protein n=1 Tax=Peptostreptococcus porci TaxID=2652282 RepID=UPI002A839123|nr:hypothetical protein [Peptostreptococcus porci]MDY4128725.1 hypothetical protein [Peptostreptococcus porci]
MSTRDSNKWDIMFFYLSILIYPLNIILSASLKFIGMNYFASKTIFILYLLVVIFEIIILFKFSISLKRVAYLIGIYFIYILLYLTAPVAIKWKFTDLNMLFIYVFYLPYAVLILSRIKDFSLLFESDTIRNINAMLIIGTFFAKYLLKDSTGYMPFSYTLLPIWIMFSISLLGKSSFIGYIIVIFIFLEGVMYGARGPIIFYIIGMIACRIVIGKKTVKRQKTVQDFIILIIKGVCIALVGIFISIQLISNNTNHSYIISKFSEGTIIASSGRDYLTNLGIRYLKHMGLNINGVFFDRTLLPNNIYIHNFILETILSFGWIFGTMILVGLLWYIVYTFCKADKNNKRVVIFLVSAYFFRYFLTGSIYDDYIFIVFLSLLYAVNNIRNEKNVLYYDKY